MAAAPTSLVMLLLVALATADGIDRGLQGRGVELATLRGTGWRQIKRRRVPAHRRAARFDAAQRACVRTAARGRVRLPKATLTQAEGHHGRPPLTAVAAGNPRQPFAVGPNSAWSLSSGGRAELAAAARSNRRPSPPR